MHPVLAVASRSTPCPQCIDIVPGGHERAGRESPERVPDPTLERVEGAALGPPLLTDRYSCLPLREGSGLRAGSGTVAVSRRRGAAVERARAGTRGEVLDEPAH